MGRALMDSRMLDLPLANVFYRWLLGEEKQLWLGDIGQLDLDMLKSFQQVYQFLVEKLDVEADSSHVRIHHQSLEVADGI